MGASFEPRKAAQVAAFFCQKAGGSINVLKLVKLMYLTDREGLAEAGIPVTYDRFVSMKNGPVVSEAYNYIKGESVSADWEDLIGDRANHTIELARPLTEDDEDELSKFDLRMLNAVWAKFGHMGKWDLVKWTHENCPEWEDPGMSSHPIPYERVLRFLNPETAKAREEHLREMQGLRAALTRK